MGVVQELQVSVFQLQPEVERRLVADPSYGDRLVGYAELVVDHLFRGIHRFSFVSVNTSPDDDVEVEVSFSEKDKGKYARVLWAALAFAGICMTGFGLIENMIPICIFGFGFFADYSDAVVSAESGSSKSGPFKLGLHVGLGYISTETDTEFDDYFDGKKPFSAELDLGVIAALKNIVADMFVSTGVYCSGTYWGIEKEFEYRDNVSYKEYGVVTNVPITVGYQFMNMFNVEVGTQLSFPVFVITHDDWYGYRTTWFPDDSFSAGFTLGASVVLGQSHEVGLKVNISSNDYTMYALTYNYWLF